MTLAEIRSELVNVRANLRFEQDHLPALKARAEQAAIDAAATAKGLTNGNKAKALGENAEDRARALILVLAADEPYQSALERARHHESHAERLEAELEILLDARRDAEWAIRARLAEALLARGVVEPVSAADDEFTATATTQVDNVVDEEGAWATNLPF